MTTRTKTTANDKAKLQAEIEAVLGQARTGHALVYHDMGGDNARWPAWMTAFKRSSGAYVIRDKRSHRVLYVGSSHARLYDTVTRHFQQWKRKKNWWKGMHGAHHDPGMVYQRGHCEVAIRLTSSGESRDEEARLIHKLSPRDNLVQNPEGDEEIPF
jgi:hypothetical protein